MSELSKELRESYKEFTIKKGRQPNIREKKKIKNKVKRIHNRKMFFRGIIIALGLSGLVFAKDKLPAGDNLVKNAIEMENQDAELNNNDKNDIIETTKEQKEEFLESLKAGAEKDIVVKTANYDENIEEEAELTNEDVINEIIKEYNEKNGADIKDYEFSYMKTNTLTYIGIDKDGRYVRDYKEKMPIQEYKMDPYAMNTTIYTMVDLKNGKVIGAIGELDGEIHDVYTNVIKNGKGREFVHADNEINFTEIDIPQERFGVNNKPYAVYKAVSEEAEKIINPDKENER